jgi:citronellyl-CoA dehydrogenase
MPFTVDHDEPRRILQKFIAAKINPFVDTWQKTDRSSLSTGARG